MIIKNLISRILYRIKSDNEYKKYLAGLKLYFSPAIGEPKGQVAPVCPKCGKNIKKNKSLKKSYLYQPSYNYANLPWNSGWSGHCEECGFNFCFNIENEYGGIKRVMNISAKSIPHLTYYDSGVVLSGIEISVNEFNSWNGGGKD
jgi:hypothetical protein